MGKNLPVTGKSKKSQAKKKLSKAESEVGVFSDEVRGLEGGQIFKSFRL